MKPDPMTSALQNQTPVTVIVADGDVPAHEIPLTLFRQAKRIVACDGAYRTVCALGRTPDAVVGDGDSISEEDIREMARCGVPWVKVEEQETNDLCKAFRHVRRMGWEGRIVILGAAGKREDHTIGNVFRLIDFANEFPDVEMVTNHGAFEPVLPPGRVWKVASPPDGAPISVFSPYPDAEMDSVGLEWPLKGVRFDTLWRGTLNRTTAPTFSIRTNRPAIIYRPFQSR